MRVIRGEIVLVKMPFTDFSAFKVRPTVVVQSDTNNARLNDVIVAMITRTTKLSGIEPTQVLIDIATPDGQATKLLHTSAVKCEHLITIERGLILKAIGQMPVVLMNRIDDALKASLELP